MTHHIGIYYKSYSGGASSDFFKENSTQQIIQSRNTCYLSAVYEYNTITTRLTFNSAHLRSTKESCWYYMPLLKLLQLLEFQGGSEKIVLQEYFLNKGGGGVVGIPKLYVKFWWPLFLVMKFTFLFLNEFGEKSHFYSYFSPP